MSALIPYLPNGPLVVEGYAMQVSNFDRGFEDLSNRWRVKRLIGRNTSKTSGPHEWMLQAESV
jgi:hypothetical protein